MFSSRELCLRGGKKLPAAWTVYERNTKYLCITCGKSVCQSWTFYCLPCAGAAVGAGQNELSPFDDIKAVALENESLDEERSDNVEPACKLACESDSGEDDNCDDTEYLHHPLIETTDINKHTGARNLFFNTTNVIIRHRNSLLRCLSLHIFSSNKALVNHPI